MQQAVLTRFGAHFPHEKWKSPPEKGFQSTLRGSTEWCRPKMCPCLAALALPLGVPAPSRPPAPLRAFERTTGFPQLLTQRCVKTSFSRETGGGKWRHASGEGHAQAGEEPSGRPAALPAAPGHRLGEPHALSRRMAAGSWSTLCFQKSPNRLKSPEVVQTARLLFFPALLGFLTIGQGGMV